MVISSIVLFQSARVTPVGTGYSLATQLGIFSYSVNFLVAMGWIAIESLRYRSLLLRRLALGLADPVLINRFGLWGSGCAAASLSSIGTIVCVALKMNVATDPIPLA